MSGWPALESGFPRWGVCHGSGQAWVLISQLGEEEVPRLSRAGNAENTVRGLALSHLPYVPLQAHPMGPRGRCRSNELRPVAGIGNYDFMEI